MEPKTLKLIESEDTKGLTAWESFIAREHLSDQQAQQFRRYLDLLIAWNEDINLTSIESIATIISHHFQDSLSVAQEVTFKEGDALCDVGTGAGFPGIPLKIKYPFLKVVLIEVQHKKRQFLQAVIDALGLENVEISSWDWRTFLRKTNYPITYFLARASLRPDELIRLFKPSSPYRHAELIYWASRDWQIGQEESPFFRKEYPYSIDHKKRRLIFFKAFDK